jgi:hypothetical protein
MKSLLERLKIMKTKKAIDCQNKLNKLVEFIVVNKKGKKTCFELINALSFNKRHLTQNTWQGLRDGNIINDNFAKLEEQNKIEKPNHTVNKQKSSKLILKHFNSDSESDINYNSESESESECESDEEIIYPKIEFKGHTYILDGDKLYTMDLNGNKDELFGTFSKGKVKKIKDFDV